MTIKQEITCDNCDRDIATTTNSVGFRLTLKDEILPTHSGAVTDMWIYPNLKDGDKHFCGMG